MSKFERALQTPSFWLVIFILLSSIIGLSIFQDFGVSFDEPGIYRFAPVSLGMYSTVLDPLEKPVYLRESFLHRNGIYPELFNYGPVYFMVVDLFVRGLLTLGLPTPFWDLWHLAYFLTFEAGILVFYLLCRRWLSGWASLGAAVLFATQPLILGHAFMNPKDPPFMVFFMATVYSGLIMADRTAVLQPAAPAQTFKDLPVLFHEEKQAVSREASIRFRRQLLILAGGIFLLVLMHPVWANVLQQAVNSLYEAPASSLLGGLLRTFSSNPENIPVQDFIAEGLVWLTRLEILLVVLIAGGMIRAAYRLFPGSGHLVVQALSRPFRRFLSFLINPWVILAGVIFGLTLSIRLFAPLAAGLVLVYFFWKAGRRAVFPSLAYMAIASITTYLTWPYLWDAPIKHLIKSWEFMNAFSLSGSWSSLPTLLATQYTVPAVLLALAGIIISIVEAIRGKRSVLFLFLLGWTLLPLAVLILRESILYNNFRQVLFVIPPLFMVAGVAIERVNGFLKRPAMIGLFILLMILPGIWSAIKLHPYQYVYYNELVLGRKSDFREYNGDYWGTSLKELTEYLNTAAPTDAAVRVCSIPLIFEPYLRADLQINYSCDPAPERDGEFDYVVITSPRSLDTVPYAQKDVVCTVGREDSIYGVVISLADPSK